jgi:hypothetical protein
MKKFQASETKPVRTIRNKIEKNAYHTITKTNRQMPDTQNERERLFENINAL